LPAGNHEISLSRKDLSAGIYFIKLQHDEQITVKKIVIE